VDEKFFENNKHQMFLLFFFLIRRAKAFSS